MIVSLDDIQIGEIINNRSERENQKERETKEK